MITAFIWAVVIAGVPAGLFLIAYFRPWQLVPWRAVLPWLALPARLVAPNTGRHRDRLRMTPVPDAGPVQAPRPGDPPSADGAVRAGASTAEQPHVIGCNGQCGGLAAHMEHLDDGGCPCCYCAQFAVKPAQNPGGSPVPPAAATAAPPAEAATLPRPDPAFPVAVTSPGPGQHLFSPLIMQFPGGEVGILGADGTWRIKPLAFDGRNPRETGGQPALVRPGRLAHEAWRDAAVNDA